MALSSAVMRALVIAAAAIAASPAAAQQSYPARPVRIIVPFPPGGSTDPMARWICAKLSERWNQFSLQKNPSLTPSVLYQKHWHLMALHPWDQFVAPHLH